MIKTIFFDLGGVIVPFDFKRAYTRLESLGSCPASEITRRIRSTDLVYRFESGQIVSEPFVKELSRILELKVSYEEFCDLWTCIFLTDPLLPDRMLSDLHNRCPLILLSNTNPIHFEMIRKNYPILRHFDQFVLSYEVGALKPSAKIYQEAIIRAGCAAEECFFTDDLLANVDAARTHRIDAVQFRSADQLAEELRTRGLL